MSNTTTLPKLTTAQKLIKLELDAGSPPIIAFLSNKLDIRIETVRKALRKLGVEPRSWREQVELDYGAK